MVVTVSGMVTWVRALQPEKALLEMLVIPGWMTT